MTTLRHIMTMVSLLLFIGIRVGAQGTTHTGTGVQTTAAAVQDAETTSAPMLLPLSTWTRHERTIACMPGVSSTVAATTLGSGASPVEQTVVVSSEPSAEVCHRDVDAFVVYIHFHAGGDRRTYRGGTTLWTSTVRGSIKGYRDGLWELIRDDVTIMIDQTHPEAVVVETLDVVDHPYHATADGYEELAFVIDADDDNGTPGVPGDDILGFEAPVPAAIQELLRLEVAFQDHVTYDFVGVSTPPVNVVASFGMIYEAVPLPMIGASVKASGNTVRLQWNIEASCAGDDYSNYQVELLRLYHAGEPSIHERELETVVDWNKALRFETGSAQRFVDVTLTQGEGYYAVRVRPISDKYPGGAADRRNWGPWSWSPAQGTTISIPAADIAPQPWVTAPKIAMFYYEQFDDDRLWAYTRAFDHGDGDTLRIGETMAFIDALGRVVQQQRRSIADATVVGGQTVYDFDGRPSLQTLQVPLGTKTTLGYVSELNTVSGLLGPDDFDNTATVFSPPAIAAATPSNLVSRYVSDANPDVSIASAQDVPYIRAIYQADGRQYTTSLPGEMFKPSLANLGRLGSVTYSGVSEQELVSVFGHEAPRPDAVRKVITTSMDGVIAVAYVDKYGRTIATALKGGDELAGSITDDEIVSDGAGTLLNLSGADGARETVNDFTSAFVINGVQPAGDDTYSGSITISLDKTTAVTFRHTDVARFYQFIEPDAWQATCSEYCFQCDYVVRLKITRISTLGITPVAPPEGTSFDPLWEQVGTDEPTCEEVVDADATFVVTLPAGRYVIERIIEMRTGLKQVPPVDVEQLAVVALATMRPLAEIMTDVFGTTDDAEEQWDNYLAYRDTHEDGVSMRQVSAEACPSIPLPLIPCDEDPCPDPLDLETYLIEQYLTAKGLPTTSADIDAFKISNEINHLIRRQRPDNLNFEDFFLKSGGTYPGAGTQGWGLINSFVPTLIAEDIPCETVWQAWREAVAMAMATLPGEEPNRPEVDIIDRWMQLVNHPKSGRYVHTGSVSSFYSDYVAFMHEKIYCPDSTCYGCAHIVPHPAFERCVRGKLADAYREKINEAGHGNAFAEDIVLESGLTYPTPCTIPAVGATPLEQAAYLDCLEEYLRSSCLRHCDEKRSLFFSIVRETLIRWYGEESVTEKEVACKAEMMFQDCKDGCNIDLDSPDPGSKTAFIERMMGVPTLAEPEDDECPAGYQRPGLPVDALDLLITYLNERHVELASGQYIDLFGRLRWRVGRTSQFCHNFATDIHKFLSQYLPPEEIPACIVAYAGLPADCGLDTYGNPINPFSLTILPGVTGVFHRDTRVEASECCDLNYTGGRRLTYDHPWPTVLNDFMDETWGRTMAYDPMDIDTVVSYTYPSDGRKIKAALLNMAGPNVGTYAATAATALRNDLRASSRYVNGAPAAFYAARTVPPLADFEDWDINIWSMDFAPWDGPFGTIRFSELSALSVDDPAKPYDDDWKLFGYLDLSFNFMHPTLRPWSGTRGGTPDGRRIGRSTFGAGNRGWNQIIGIHNPFGYVGVAFSASLWNPTGYPAAALWDDGRASINSWNWHFSNPFTTTIGRFGEDALGRLIFVSHWLSSPDHDGHYHYGHVPTTAYISVFDHVRFYERYSRKLIDHEDACFAETPLCVPEECVTCVKWEIPNPDPDDYPSVRRYTCADYKVMEAKRRIETEYAIRRARAEHVARSTYRNQCLNPRMYDDKVTVSFSDVLYHYTLAYYDRAGNLVRTVPPNGVSIDPDRTRADVPPHTMVTSYTLDGAGSTRTSETPDAGETTVIYDSRRRPRFTQKAEQATRDRWTYVKYDHLGRSVESGEFEHSGTPSRANADDASYPASASADLVRTVYSIPAPAGTFDDYGVGTAQKNLRGRVSYTISDKNGNLASTDDQVITYYSYDAVGHVTWQVQSTPGLGLARTEYDIHQGSGRVKRVSFERGRSAQFFTEYDYDADGRVTAIRTSPNGVLWDQDAHYTYAKDGTLRRTVIGEDSLQGIDYTYTLHGQLKGINVPTLDEDDDPGHDGKTSTPTSEIPKDAFGMALEYYAGDFERSGSIFHTGTSPPSTRLAPEGTLYGGNITAWSMKTLATGGGMEDDGLLTGETYRYDRIGRLRGATYKTNNGTSWSGAANEGYSSAYRYDGNGNIMGIERWTLDGSGATEKMDDQTHHLAANKNQLERVEETAPVQATEVVAGYDDVKHQSTTTYDYDVSGRMIADAAEDHAITYTSHDKVSQITIGGTTTITRLYGPDGRNVSSTSTTGGSSKRTYQIYGGGIDPVAIVTQDGEGDPVVSEILIQGLGRVGVYTGDNTVAYGTTIPPPASYEIYHRTVGRKLYELTDHIGNVRAVIGDIKEPLGSDAYGVQLRSVQNYYPYGMPRPNNVWSATTLTQSDPYRFGFQGMQRDADVGNATTAPSTTPFRQYDARLGRWWSVDPLSAMTGKTYQALGGNPISMVDPWGLEDEGKQSTVGVDKCYVHIDEGDFVLEVWDNGTTRFKQKLVITQFRTDESAADWGFTGSYRDGERVSLLGMFDLNYRHYKGRIVDNESFESEVREFTMSLVMQGDVFENTTPLPDEQWHIRRPWEFKFDLNNLSPEFWLLVGSYLPPAPADGTPPGPYHKPPQGGGVVDNSFEIFTLGQLGTGLIKNALQNAMAKATSTAIKKAAVDDGMLLINRWGPMSGRGPLRADYGNTFRSSTYNEVITTRPMTLYRSYGGNAGVEGNFWAFEAPKGPLQVQMDFAILPAWNSATQSTQMLFPAGTRLFIGPTASQGAMLGGGVQAILSNPYTTGMIP